MVGAIPYVIAMLIMVRVAMFKGTKQYSVLCEAVIEQTVLGVLDGIGIMYQWYSDTSMYPQQDKIDTTVAAGVSHGQ